jgi:hypothetical protein
MNSNEFILEVSDETSDAQKTCAIIRICAIITLVRSVSNDTHDKTKK